MGLGLGLGLGLGMGLGLALLLAQPVDVRGVELDLRGRLDDAREEGAALVVVGVPGEG